MKAHINTEKEVLRVYKKVNPSTYKIEKRPKVYKERENFIANLFLHRLNFPPKMFKDASVLELKCGTGEHSLFYLKWGAQCTFVEMNDHSCRRAEMLFKKFGAKKGQFKIVNKSIFDYKSSQ